MPQYEIYAPIALTADNFDAFTDLMASGPAVMPAQIAAFAAAHKANAFREILGPAALVVPSANGGYTQIRLFAADNTNPPNPSKMAALFLDVIPLGDGNFNSQPRQWLLGKDAQALIPYKMSCCSGLSAIAAYKQGGKLQPSLLENQRFVVLAKSDLFSLQKPGESGLKVDTTGEILSSWYTHLMRIKHDCSSHAKIAVPTKLPAFRKN